MPNDFDGNPNWEASLNLFRETTPRIWWNLYQGCLERGFSQSDSMVLLQTYIMAQGPHGSRPPEGSGPESDKPGD